MTRLPVRVLSAVLLLSACGTTVSVQSIPGADSQMVTPSGSNVASPGATGVPAPGSLEGLSGPAASAAAPASVTAGSVGGSLASGASTAAPVTPTGSTVGSSTTTGRTGAAAPGVTRTSITVGLPYKQNAAAANAAAGANIDPGDEPAVWKALVNWINKHGGIAGRQIKPLLYAIDATTPDTTAQVEEAMCAYYTQDHHTFAVLTIGDATLVRCVLKAGSVMVGEDLTINNAAFFQRFPYYVEPSDLNLDRIAANEIPRLVAESYFGAHPKVGIVTYDDPSFGEAVDHVMVPALAHAGYAGPEIERIYEPDALSGLSQEAASIQNAVLKFKTDNVDHVLFLEQSGYIPLLFMNDAESQHYFPRYGFNSQDAPQVLATSGDVSADQLKDSAGIGWVPVLDLPSDPPNGPYSNANRRKCEAVVRAAGVSIASQDAETVVVLFCDELLFLKAAVEKGGSAAVSRDSFLRGTNTLGTAYVSPMSSGPTLFSPGHHDGVAVVHDYVYDGKCGCMSYRGSAHRAV